MVSHEFSAVEPVGTYWLSRSVGFQVVPERGRCGIVEEVRCLPPRGIARVLVVRVKRGRDVTRRPVAVEDVEAIDPWNEQVYVRGSLRRCARNAGVINESLGP